MWIEKKVKQDLSLADVRLPKTGWQRFESQVDHHFLPIRKELLKGIKGDEAGRNL